MDANLAANAARETVLQTVRQHLDMLKQIDDLVAQYPESPLVQRSGASISEAVVRETTELFAALLDASLHSIASRVEPGLRFAQAPAPPELPTSNPMRELLSSMRPSTQSAHPSVKGGSQ